MCTRSDVGVAFGGASVGVVVVRRRGGRGGIEKKKKKTTYGTGAGYNVTGRAFAMSVAVLPLSARHTMSFAPTLCADRTADDAVASTDGIGIGWWSMTCLNTE